jgi:hypothetical protein
MAQVGAIISYSFVDQIHVPASTPFYVLVDDTQTVADVMTKLQADIALVAGITDDGIASVKLELEANVSAYLTPAADSESEQGLLINLNQANSIYAQPEWIPALKDSLVVGGKVVITAGGPIDLLLAQLTALGGVYEYVSKYKNRIFSLRDAAQSFRKLRRRSEKITKVFA